MRLRKLIYLAIPAILIAQFIAFSFISCTNDKDKTYKNTSIENSPNYSKPKILFNKTITGLTELSGLAASKKNKSIFWAHNDSKSSATIYAFNIKGKVINTIQLKKMKDWEDMCIGNYKGIEYIFMGDVGDNNKKRSHYSITAIKEPDCNEQKILPTQNLEPVKYKFVYSDGQPHDCESIAYNSKVNKGTIFLLTKKGKPQLFKLELDKLKPNKLNTATEIGKYKLNNLKNPSAIDISRDGKKMVVRNEKTVYLFKIDNPKNFIKILTQKVLALPCPSEPNGEAITFDPVDESLYTSSEEEPVILYQLSKIN